MIGYFREAFGEYQHLLEEKRRQETQHNAASGPGAAAT